MLHVQSFHPHLFAALLLQAVLCPLGPNASKHLHGQAGHAELSVRSAGGEAAALAWSASETGVLALGGSGHVSTWRCAATFTGAKLQGELAHYGEHAPADVAALLILHNGQASPRPFLYGCLVEVL